MKVKTLKRFKDKNTGAIHEVGDVFVVNKNRYEEILKAGKFVVSFESDQEETSESDNVSVEEEGE